MKTPFDDCEITFIHPLALMLLVKARKQANSLTVAEIILREQAKAAGIAIRVVMDAITAAVETFSAAWDVMMESLSDAFRQISELRDEVEKILECDPADATLKRWRNAENQYSRVSMVKYKQFERERVNRNAEMRRITKKGWSGRRIGPKKAKKH